MCARPQIKALVILADEICRDGQLLQIVDGEGRFVVRRMEFGMAAAKRARDRTSVLDRSPRTSCVLPTASSGLAWQSEVRMRDGVALSRWTGSGRPLAKLRANPQLPGGALSDHTYRVIEVVGARQPSTAPSATRSNERHGPLVTSTGFRCPKSGVTSKTAPLATFRWG